MIFQDEANFHHLGSGVANDAIDDLAQGAQGIARQPAGQLIDG
jgi:hypothetical protein